MDRIAWFHVPKTGSSFANTLMHLANTSLPANAFIQTKAKDLKEMGFGNSPWTRGFASSSGSRGAEVVTMDLAGSVITLPSAPPFTHSLQGISSACSDSQ